MEGNIKFLIIAMAIVLLAVYIVEPMVNDDVPTENEVLGVDIGEVQLICDSSRGQSSPQVSGDNAVWVDYRNGNWDIYGYNFASDTGYAVVENYTTQDSVYIHGNTVIFLWEDVDTNTFEIVKFYLNNHTFYHTGIFISSPSILYGDSDEYAICRESSDYFDQYIYSHDENTLTLIAGSLFDYYYLGSWGIQDDWCSFYNYEIIIIPNQVTYNWDFVTLNINTGYNRVVESGTIVRHTDEPTRREGHDIVPARCGWYGDAMVYTETEYLGGADYAYTAINTVKAFDYNTGHTDVLFDYVGKISDVNVQDGLYVYAYQTEAGEPYNLQIYDIANEESTEIPLTTGNNYVNSLDNSDGLIVFSAMDVTSVSGEYLNIFAVEIEGYEPITDADGDGLPDDWEMEYFGSLDEDGDGDYDEDGYTNLEEFQAGTDPTDPDDFPTAPADPIRDNLTTIIIGAVGIAVLIGLEMGYYKSKHIKAINDKVPIGIVASIIAIVLIVIYLIL